MVPGQHRIKPRYVEVATESRTEGKGASQAKADEKEERSNEELCAFANSGKKRAARRGVPDLDQW